MAVPEAPVNEDDRVVLGEDNVGSPRQTFIIDAIAEAPAPESKAQFQLRAGILGPVMRHAFETLLWSHRYMDYDANLRRFD